MSKENKSTDRSKDNSLQKELLGIQKHVKWIQKHCEKIYPAKEHLLSEPENQALKALLAATLAFENEEGQTGQKIIVYLFSGRESRMAVPGMMGEMEELLPYVHHVSEAVTTSYIGTPALEKDSWFKRIEAILQIDECICCVVVLGQDSFGPKRWAIDAEINVARNNGRPVLFCGLQDDQLYEYQTSLDQILLAGNEVFSWEYTKEELLSKAD